jgi:hypothetical protein
MTEFIHHLSSGLRRASYRFAVSSITGRLPRNFLRASRPRISDGPGTGLRDDVDCQPAPPSQWKNDRTAKHFACISPLAEMLLVLPAIGDQHRADERDRYCELRKSGWPRQASVLFHYFIICKEKIVTEKKLDQQVDKKGTRTDQHINQSKGSINQKDSLDENALDRVSGGVKRS